MAQPWCRVLLVEPGEGLWGAQRYVLNLAELMAERGVEQVLAAPGQTELAQAWRAAGRQVVTFEPPADRSIRRGDGRLSPGLAARELGRLLNSAGRIGRLARKAGADVLQANTHWTHLEVVLAGRLTRRPAVLHLLDQSRRDALGRLRAIAVMGAAGSIACSQAVIDTLPPRAAARVLPVPIGIDAQRYSPATADPDVRAQLTADPTSAVALVLARIAPGKGIADVIRAIGALPPELGPVALAIAGASEDPAFEAQIRRLGEELLGDRLRLLGARPDVPDLLRSADVLVLASEAEGMPLSILEAQATGLPVVAYPAGGGAAELITPEVTGLLARQGDVADLSRQLSRVFNDPDLARGVAARARSRVLAELTLEHQADQHAALLRGVTGRRPAPTSDVPRNP